MKWMSVMKAELISSEEDENEEESLLIIKTIPWRATKVTDFLELWTVYTIKKNLPNRKNRQNREIESERKALDQLIKCHFNATVLVFDNWEFVLVCSLNFLY